jgi:hydrogenase-4 component B
MSSEQLLLSSFAVLLIGAGLTALVGKARRAAGYLALLTMALAAAGLCVVGVRALLWGPIQVGPLFSVSGLGATLTLRVDGLGGLFLIVISFVGVCATLYSIDYMLIYREEDLRRYYPFFLLFVLGMVGVVTSWDMFFFFVFWEFMTLASYLLVVFEKSSAVNLRAGIKYFVMTHVATAFMLVAAILLWRVGGASFAFPAMKSGLQALGGSPLLHVVLAFFLIGFATKAGVFPFGDWLPDAHPAAPSGVSAMLSGVMIKMGVYGVLRVFVWMLPISHASLIWGGVIATAGAVSLFVGTLTALTQTDAKRLLAFHSIGQMGYIWLGLGTAIAFMPIAAPVAVVALIASLYHMINHACFKSLLFLSAGSILHRTGTRDLNQLGGLRKFMPLTAVTALAASLAISGIPPMNGFASKWMLYQVTLLGGADVPMYLVFGLVALFISGVTLASFMKFMATSFWGSWPGKEPPRATRDVPSTMQASQVILALACVALGIVPLAAVWGLFRAVSPLVPVGYQPAFASLFQSAQGGSAIWRGLGTNLGEGLATAWGPIVVLIAGLLCLLIANRIYHLGHAPVRTSETWYSGEALTARQGHYWASSFYLPFEDFLRMRIGRHRTSGVYPRLPLPRLPDPESLRRALDLDNRFYYPLVRWGAGLLERLRETHVGIPQVYVLWMVGGTVLAVIVLFSLSH